MVINKTAENVICKLENCRTYGLTCELTRNQIYWLLEHIENQHNIIQRIGAERDHILKDYQEFLEYIRSLKYSNRGNDKAHD